MKHYILCDIKLLSVNTILTGHTGLLKSLNDACFSYTYKALPYAAKPTAGDGPFYISSTADYIKNLVIRTKEQVRLDGINISMEMLHLRR